ncbi:MAG: HTTM domain-containing protein [Cytophagales bacterium]|nr:HTTM domain-containing protein [Armatimonadota bacterium]
MGEARAKAKGERSHPQSAALMPPWWLRGADRLFAIDLRSLALLRVLLAALVLADLVGRAGDLAAHYTDSGILPRAALLARDPANWSPHFSVHMLTGTEAGEAAWFVLAALWAVALLVGYRTPISTVATWYLLSSVQLRNPLILNSADDLLRMLLFWGMFLPLGARGSLDARTGHGPSLPPLQPRFLSVGSAALLLQVGFLYWFAVASKTDPSWHVDGTAVYYALSIDLYATPVGQFLLNVPQLLQVMTWMTLWMEAGGPTLAFLLPFPRVRLALVLAFFTFHLVLLNATLDLGAFHYVSAVAWVPFLPTQFWDWAERGAGRYLPRRRAAAAPLVSLSGGTEAQAARVAEREWVLASQSPPAEPVLRRYRFNWRAILLNTVAGLLLVYIFLWNFRATGNRWGPRLLPYSLNRVAQVTHVDQGWQMFAPKPLTEDGWFVYPAKLRDGTTLDLFRGESTLGKPIRWEKPDILVSHEFKNERWRRYEMNLWARIYSDQRPVYCRYLCREWNKTHTGQKRLSSLQLYYVIEETLTDYVQATSLPRIMIDWKCDEGHNAGAGRNQASKSAGDIDASGRVGSDRNPSDHRGLRQKEGQSAPTP